MLGFTGRSERKISPGGALQSWVSFTKASHLGTPLVLFALVKLHICVPPLSFRARETPGSFAETVAFRCPRFLLSASLDSLPSSPAPKAPSSARIEINLVTRAGTGCDPGHGTPRSGGRGKRRGSCGPGGAPVGEACLLARRGAEPVPSRSSGSLGRFARAAGGSGASSPPGLRAARLFFPEVPTSPSLGQLGARSHFPGLYVSAIFPRRFGYSTSPPGVKGCHAGGQRRRQDPRQAPPQFFAP